MRNKSKLGEILVEAGRLTNTQLQQALAEHKKKGLRLGQYLVREGYLSESEIVDVLSRQLKLETYRPDKFFLDMTLSKVLPADLAHRCQAVPLKKADMLLTVAMTDPQNIRAIDAIEQHVKTEVEIVLCTEQHLNHLISSIYGSFAGGLRSILRQDPDVVMVGEVRDKETAKIAVQAALTGHMVLTTLHTNDAAGAITRLIDMGVEPFLVSSVLGVSFSQRLVRKVCPGCKEAYRPSGDVLRYWQLEGNGDYDFVQGKGCFHCMHTGYKGRTGVYEVLTINNEI